MKCNLIWRSLPKEWKKCDTNSELQSDVTCDRTPCLEKTWVRNNLATCGAFTVSWEGMNIACFIKWSMTTRIVEKPSEAGSCSMKSIEMVSQLAMGCVTCHACHGCVMDFRPILGNPVEVAHMTSPGTVYISHTKGTYFPLARISTMIPL